MATDGLNIDGLQSLPAYKHILVLGRRLYLDMCPINTANDSGKSSP